MVREKVREKSLFSKPRNCQGFLTSVREFFNLSQNQEILKNRFIKCQTTMNTNILSPVACPYEHKTEISKLDVEIQYVDHNKLILLFSATVDIHGAVLDCDLWTRRGINFCYCTSHNFIGKCSSSYMTQDLLFP